MLPTGGEIVHRYSVRKTPEAVNRTDCPALRLALEGTTVSGAEAPGALVFERFRMASAVCPLLCP
jgi:hypothetical protein